MNSADGNDYRGHSVEVCVVWGSAVQERDSEKSKMTRKFLVLEAGENADQSGRPSRRHFHLTI